MKPSHIKNYITHTVADLISVSSTTRFSQKDYEDILRIINQHNVHSVLFPKSPTMKFDIEKTRSFIEFYKKGDTHNTNHLFLLKTKESIVGGVDLQIVDNDTTSLGFWQDTNQTGFMTNAILSIVGIARQKNLKALDAYVDLDNHKAMRLLKRSGFSYKGIVKGKTRNLKKFVKSLLS